MACQSAPPSRKAAPTPAPSADVPTMGDAPYAAWIAIASGPVPGFAGASTSYTRAPDGSISKCFLNVMLTDTLAQGLAATRYFATPESHRWFSPPACGHVKTIVLRQVKYGIPQLFAWYDGINQARRAKGPPIPAGQPPIFMASSIDVRNNRLVFSTSDLGALALLKATADSLLIPADAVEFSGDMQRIFGSSSPLPAPGLDSTGSIYFEFQVDKPAVMRMSDFTRIHALARANAELRGDALVQFVVDPTGTPDISTFKVLRVSDNRLSTFLRMNLGSARFSPAEKRDRAVPQLVQMTFHF